jgi:hypothetical protein
VIDDPRSLDVAGAGRCLDEIVVWYQRIAGIAYRTDGVTVEVHGHDFWMTFDLTSTTLAGVVLDPFVFDHGAGCWFQGWSNGQLLTVAASSSGLGLAAAFLRHVVVVGAESASE